MDSDRPRADEGDQRSSGRTDRERDDDELERTSDRTPRRYDSRDDRRREDSDTEESDSEDRRDRRRRGAGGDEDKRDNWPREDPPRSRGAIRGLSLKKTKVPTKVSAVLGFLARSKQKK
jgi:hypothetical protein